MEIQKRYHRKQGKRNLQEAEKGSCGVYGLNKNKSLDLAAARSWLEWGGRTGVATRLSTSALNPGQCCT